MCALPAFDTVHSMDRALAFAQCLLDAGEQIRNPRTTDVQAQTAALQSKKGVRWQHPRPGEHVALCVQRVQIEGIERALRRVLRRVLRLTDRTIGARGQQLLALELTREAWTTSLPARLEAREVIDAYADHGTHEQSHSELEARDYRRICTFDRPGRSAGSLTLPGIQWSRIQAIV